MAITGGRNADVVEVTLPIRVINFLSLGGGIQPLVMIRWLQMGLISHL